MDKDKRIVDSYIEDIDLYNVTNPTPSQAIEAIKQIQDKYKDRDIYFAIDGCGYGEGYGVALWERRLETDKEYTTRLKIETKNLKAQSEAKEKKEAKDRKEYERLKKKYG
jgi:hypothetical protein